MTRVTQSIRRLKRHAITGAVAATLAVLTLPSLADAPVADAAEKADWARVTSLLKESPRPNEVQPDGMTALHWAVHHNHAQTAKALLASGANPKVENRFGVTPLSVACTNGNAAMVKLLLDAGADPNTSLRGGETALMTAARVGRADAVQALLDAGAKIDATDRKGQTALMWAAAEGNADVIRTLVKAGADPKARLRSGFTPMLFAVREGKTDAVKTLLDLGVDANEAIQTDRRGDARVPGTGMSALSLAVENGHFELALELIKAGADPNDQRSGVTVLHRLTWVRKPNRGDDPDGQPPPSGSGNINSLQFARELISRGANVNARIERGTSARGKLTTTGATPFLLASKTADLPYMQLLVEKGADPKLPNKDGATPLMAAAGLGTTAPDEEAGTEAECLAAVEYLLSQGAEINTVDQNGETAMHGAAYKSLPKMVHLLADRGAKIDVWNKKNKYGWTPLLIAEGFRPGNFKPSFETIDAIHAVMRQAGLTPPPPTKRTDKDTPAYEEPG